MIAELLLSAALLCFEGECVPVLAGKSTPIGLFPLQHGRDMKMGDYLAFQFDWERGEVFAIHATVPGREGFYKMTPGIRAQVTNGCVNVRPWDLKPLLRSAQWLKVNP